MSLTNMGPWLVCPRRAPDASLRLFCFPYAGGGASVFHTWQRNLPAHVEVVAVQLPGRGSRMREAPFTRLAPLVEVATEVLLPHLDKPFALFGHSMGALVGFEIARQLRRLHDLTPLRLFVSGSNAPHRPSSILSSFHNASDDVLLGELGRMGGGAQKVWEHPEFMKIMLPTLRADFEVVATYEYYDEPPLACPITAFGGSHDQIVNGDDLDAWRVHTSSAFSYRVLPGDHLFPYTSEVHFFPALSEELQGLSVVTLLPSKANED